MVQGGQYSSVRPTGMRKKKFGRMAPIVEEQAQQGLATQMVVQGKQRAQQQAETKFNQEARTQDLAMQKESLAQAKKTQKRQEMMGYANLGINVLSNAGSIIDFVGGLF